MAAQFEIDAFQLQVGITCSINAHTSSITFGGRVTTGAVEDNLTTILATYEAALPDLAQDMSTDYSMNDVRISWSTAGGDTTSADAPFVGGAITGGQGGDVIDPRGAFVLRKKSFGTGRRGCGRLFLPGVVDGTVDPSGLVEASFLTGINNHCTSFMAALSSPGGGLEPYDLRVNGFTSAGAPHSYATTTLSCAITMGLVRRRIKV